MNKSFIYKSPIIYRAIMLCLYGREYFYRFHMLGEYLENNSSVVDLCCGFGDFYQYALKDKSISYIGIDSSKEFVAFGKSKGIDIRLGNVDDLPFPPVDYYVMTDSLYHFYDSPHLIIKKMLSAAKKGVLIMEPVKNLTNSKYAIVSWLAKHMTNEGLSRNQHRFSEESLDGVVNNYFGNILVDKKLTKGGRDKIYFLKKH